MASEMAPQCSTRIQRTNSAIIDVLLTKYGNVKFNLAPGATFFGMHSAVREKIRKLLSDDEASSYLSKYGDVLGSPDLCERWVNVIGNGNRPVATPRTEEESRELGCDGIFPTHEFMITAGANQGFVNVILAICDPSDEVLLILPYYFSHVNALVMTGVKPVPVPVDSATLLPRIEDIEERVTDKSKAVVVVNPGNPSGIVFSKALLERIVNLCKRYRLWLVLDEAYREFVFDGLESPAFSPPPANNIIKMYTMSKAYGLAGWRVGALLYPRTCSENMRKAQDTIPTHASRISQTVACEALQYNPLDSSIESSHIKQVDQVRRAFITALKPVYEASKLSEFFVVPNGAFYFFLPYECPRNLNRVTSDDDLRVVEYLAKKHSTLVCPGFAFGMPGYIRVSYGTITPSQASSVARMLARGLFELFRGMPV